MSNTFVVGSHATVAPAGSGPESSSSQRSTGDQLTRRSAADTHWRRWGPQAPLPSRFAQAQAPVTASPVETPQSAAASVFSGPGWSGWTSAGPNAALHSSSPSSRTTAHRANSGGLTSSMGRGSDGGAARQSAKLSAAPRRSLRPALMLLTTGVLLLGFASLQLLGSGLPNAWHPSWPAHAPSWASAFTPSRKMQPHTSIAGAHPARGRGHRGAMALPSLQQLLPNQAAAAGGTQEEAATAPAKTATAAHTQGAATATAIKSGAAAGTATANFKPVLIKASPVRTAVAAAASSGAGLLQGAYKFATPIVPYPHRVPDQRVVGVVFYGRRLRVHILNCYLQRNLVRNGGLLEHVVFVVATYERTDLDYLDGLLKKYPGDYKKVIPVRLDKGYTGHYAWMDPATTYVKIDDDVAYIGDNAIDLMLEEHVKRRYLLVSANVVNHQPLEGVHSANGAHRCYGRANATDATSWQPISAAGHPDIVKGCAPPPAPQQQAGVAPGMNAGAVAGAQPLRFIDNGWDVWGEWRRAANVHYSFLDNFRAGRLWQYEFPAGQKLYDFNRHHGWTRWRINMFMFKAADIDVHIYNMSSTIGTYPGDDEDWITRLLPQQLNRTSAAVSGALAVHFSFYPQKEGLENSTDLIARYTNLARQICGDTMD